MGQRPKGHTAVLIMRQTTRTVLSIITTLAIGAMAGIILWQTIAAWGDERYALASGGTFASLAMLTLFSVSLQESTRRLRKRGYARPVSSGTGLFESVMRVARQDTHPVNIREVVTVKFDDGAAVVVDVTDLYYKLVTDANRQTVLSWHRWRDKLDRHQWQAYRHLLEQAGVVDIDGRGAMRLNCSPWAAIEAVRGIDR